MPAKTPKMPKNATQEQLDEYSQKLEQYFKDKEKDLADQQLESDRTLAELLKEKTNIVERKGDCGIAREKCISTSRTGEEHG